MVGIWLAWQQWVVDFILQHDYFIFKSNENLRGFSADDHVDSVLVIMSREVPTESSYVPDTEMTLFSDSQDLITISTETDINNCFLIICSHT